MSTYKTVRFVHAQNGPAFRTGPFGVFAFDKSIYSNFLDAIQIIDWTCCIIGAVAHIQMLQGCARKLITIKTVLNFAFYSFIAVLNLAGYASVRFVMIVTTAARTGFLFPDEGAAQAAVDPTRANQNWTGRFWV